MIAGSSGASQLPSALALGDAVPDRGRQAARQVELGATGLPQVEVARKGDAAGP